MAFLDDLLNELGYNESAFYGEDAEKGDLGVAHLLRDAKRAGVQGTYSIQTGPNRTRPAVQIANARTSDQGRAIHKNLWNQGTTPFVVLSMPGQVRVYTPFAFDDKDMATGLVEPPIDTGSGLRHVANQLKFLHADAIDSGEIWRLKGDYLDKEKRIDRTLLRTLRSLSSELITKFQLKQDVAHALIGRFVYLYYLWDREVLSSEWLEKVGVEPNSVFSHSASMSAFRRLTDAVDDRFNGNIFPIKWSATTAPKADAVTYTARVFAGEEPKSGQMSLFRMFDFSYIPIEFLSAIYEQFLHDEGNGEEDGAFYTSEPLADYLISELESVRPLENGNRALDPCCGSGVFLVLTYRHLVEKELRRRRTNKLAPYELKEILTRSIFGVERNPEACLVTEFNLILALLSYVDPPELHRHERFTFPNLHNTQIFEADFFDEKLPIWNGDRQFEWILGNPPWVELASTDDDEKPILDWMKANRDEFPVARYRTGEAFTWRVRERLADNGVIGLVTQATSLTNDQSDGYRKAFFTKNQVHRITNFANLAYLLFESAEEPAANVVYSPLSEGGPADDIIHYGPLVVHQVATSPGTYRRRRVPWVLSVCESEIQTIPAAEAAKGLGTTWKCALWGNIRDRRVLERLRRILPTTLEALSEKRGWHLNLGVQLRSSGGTEHDPNQLVEELAGLPVLDPKRMATSSHRMTIPSNWLVENEFGLFVRKRGGFGGVRLTKHPHLFLWNEFAAYSDEDLIFRHPKIGVSTPKSDSNWLRAISVLWSSSITPYVLFLELSAGWGISRSTIDLNDAKQMPLPEFTDVQVSDLASFHRSMAKEEPIGIDRSEWQKQVDEKIVATLGVPLQTMLIAREFVDFRLRLVKGKAPRDLTGAPDNLQLEAYANRLRLELDGFLERKKRRHEVLVAKTSAGIVVSVELLREGERAKLSPLVRVGDDDTTVKDILKAARQKYGQWVYVQRSVRIFSADQKVIYIIKPARRLEWTETQAILDAGDIIAEVASRGQTQ